MSHNKFFMWFLSAVKLNLVLESHGIRIEAYLEHHLKAFPLGPPRIWCLYFYILNRCLKSWIDIGRDVSRRCGTDARVSDQVRRKTCRLGFENAHRSALDIHYQPMKGIITINVTGLTP